MSPVDRSSEMAAQRRQFTRGCAKSLPWLLGLLVRLGIASQKHWLPNLEWQTSNNWADDFVPVAESRVVFPLEMRHAVGLPRSGSLALAGIDLPRYGNVVLPYRGSLEMSPVTKRSNGKTATWRRKGPLFWADPDNWNSSSKATPHLERIPCTTDLVVLPPKYRILSVRLPGSNVRVKAVKMADESEPLATWEWIKLEDRREFSQGPFSVRYSNLGSCEACPCQDGDRTELLAEVCNIQRRKCERTAICEYPLEVEGHCCRYCGARVLLSARTSLSELEARVNEAFEAFDPWKETLSWHVRSTWNGQAEVLVTERTSYSGIKSAEAIDDLAEFLRGAGIEVLGTESAGAALGTSKLPVTLGPLFGALLIVLLLLFVAFPYFGHSFAEIVAGWTEARATINEETRAKESSRSGRPFTFARFDNVPEGNVELAYPAAADDRAELTKGESPSSFTGGRFINPLYRSGRGSSSSSSSSSKVDERRDDAKSSLDGQSIIY